MKTLRKLRLTTFAILFSLAAFGQNVPANKKAGTAKDSLRLFLIGNSFSQNATRYLPQLAQEGGHPLVIGRAEIGGASMQRHWDAVEAAMRDTSDPKGKPYKGQSLRMLLSEGRWDVVTIQQASILSGDVNTYRPYAKKLYDFIKSLQPNAKIVLHETWAYRSDDDSMGNIRANQRAASAKEMYDSLANAYRTIAKELNIEMIPNGDAFNNVSTGGTFSFKKDITYNYTQPAHPKLPNQAYSLHTGYSWDREQKLNFDSHHASIAGCYLGGLVWYTFLFKESPVKLKFKPTEVPADFAEYLKKTAAKTVLQKQTSAVKPVLQ
jgi:hypothetical protein